MKLKEGFGEQIDRFYKDWLDRQIEAVKQSEIEALEDIGLPPIRRIGTDDIMLSNAITVMELARIAEGNIYVKFAENESLWDRYHFTYKGVEVYALEDKKLREEFKAKMLEIFEVTEDEIGTI